MAAPVESRLAAVEQVLLELAQSQARTQAQLDQFSADTREFRDEMRAFKDEMREFKDESRAMSARADRRWGELANRMGTLTEDILLPGIPTVFRLFFGDDGRPDMAVRVWRTHPTDPGRAEEYDAIVSRGDVLLVAESKSTLRPEHVSEFRDKLARSRGFLPEAQGRRVFGVLGSFLLDPSLVGAGERHGLIMVGLGTGLLQVLNGTGFAPRAF
jgi:hypothetical protein